MNSKVLFALCFALFVSSVVFAGSSESHSDASSDSDGSDSSGSSEASMGSFGDSQERQEEECDGLVEGSDQNGGDCELIQGLVNISISVEITWTSEQRSIFEQFIAQLRILLSQTGFSNEQRIIMADASFKTFILEHTEVYELIKFQNISTWGYMQNLGVMINYKQMKYLEATLSLDENNECPLFEALLNGTSGACQNGLRDLINNTLIDILSNTSISVKKRSILVSLAIQDFLVVYKDYRFEVGTVFVPGFGSIEQLLSLGITLHQRYTYTSILVGAVEECTVVKSIQAQLDFWAANPGSVQLTVAAQVKAFLQDLKAALSVQVGAKMRLSILIKTLRAHVKLHKYLIQILFSISIEGFGSLGDLINCGGFIIGFQPGSSSTGVSVSPSPSCTCTCA